MSLGSLPRMNQRMPKGGRWNWYQDGPGGREWRPMTSLLKDSLGESSYALEAWKMRGVLLGTAAREDIRTAALAEGADGDKRTLDRLANDALDASKSSDGGRLGTAMHTITERIDAGEDVLKVTAGLPPEHRASAQAYEALLRLNEWEVVEQERTVRMSELDVAGTFDKLYRVPGYGLVIGDVKTEKDPLLNLQKIGAQMGGYSRGDAMWGPSGWEPSSYLAEMNQHVGIIVHVRNGDAIPILIDLSRGYAAALSARDNLRRSQEAKRKPGAEGAWAYPMTVKRMPAQTLTAEAVTRGYGRNLDIADPVDAAFGTLAAVTETADLSLPTRQMLIERIWEAPTREVLGALYEWAEEKGVPWRGPVEQAGAARLRIVECVQRELHVTGAKCACGWIPSVAA